MSTLTGKEYFELGQGLHKIKENLEWRRDTLNASLERFKKTKDTTLNQYYDAGVDAAVSWHDFMDISCYVDGSDAPTFSCEFQDISEEATLKVSPTMVINGKERILKAYEFSLNIVKEQLAEVEQEIERLQSIKNA